MTDENYLPISIATLLPSKTVGLNLYQKEQGSGRLRLYRGADYPINWEDLDRLRHRNVHFLYISKDSHSRYQAYLHKLLGLSNESSHLTPERRMGVLNEAVLSVLKTSFGSRDVSESIEAIRRLGELTAKVITRDAFSVSDMFRVLHHDYATSTHSTNVAFYCGILSNALGYNEQDVEGITTGGLIHDLGKLKVDERILSKPGRLDEWEFRQVKEHPSLGFQKLAKRTDLNRGQLMMVYQHHERLDGQGYPVGCVADDIHPWAKICTVADVFEALTSDRPNRPRISRRKALEIQERGCGSAFDPEILKCWKSIIVNA